MHPTLFLATQLGFAVLTLLCLTLVVVGLWRTLKRMNCQPEKSKRAVILTLAALSGWLVFTGMISASGVAQDFSRFPPPLLPLVLLPPLVAALVLTFSKNFGRLLRQVPIEWLLYLQSFRVAVEVLLWALYEQGLLPVQMTFEGLNFDVLTGATAPMAALLLKIRPQWRNQILLWWNVVGLALLATIVAIALLSMPTPLRAFSNEPANTIVTRFPFIWLPGFLVPLAYTLHFFALRKLTLDRQKWAISSTH